MANAEQLSILKRGIETWNGWRAKNIYVYADLNQADLSGIDLSGADLRIAHLRRANLFRADLSGADLSGADLSDADLREAILDQTNLSNANLNGASLGSAFMRGANLSQANLLAANLRNARLTQSNLSEANLMVANLGGADLTGANLGKTNLTRAQLSGVNLRRADLSGASLAGAILSKSNLVEAKFISTDLIGTNVSEARLAGTLFANSNLSRVIGLESTDHRGPSHISIDTFQLSAGKIPESFLRGCGLSDADIQYAKLSNPNLTAEEMRKTFQKVYEMRTTQRPQLSPLFICYSHANSPFVEKIGGRLSEKGIRYWRDVHEVKAGRSEKPNDRVHPQNPRVLLILSGASLQSDWVEQEVTEARRLEKELGRGVLCPVALDDGWNSDRLPRQITEQIMENNILDFSAWKNRSVFEPLFQKMVDKLELYKQDP